MPIVRILAYWSVPIVFSALVAGCSPAKQPQATPRSPLSSTTAEASPSSLTQFNSAQAEPTQQVPDQANCKNPQTQAEINACASSLAEAADKRLNQVYQQLRARLKSSQREKLLTNEQLAWMKFRDADCTFERSRFEGGSIAPSIYFGCIEKITKRRTEDLENYLKSR
jgi:uncharacterized protein YecT (DUF1311 family)